MARTVFLSVIVLSIALLYIPLRPFIIEYLTFFDDDAPIQCPQAKPLIPSNSAVEKFILDKVESPAYQKEIISKLTGIIQIPSESFDDLGPIGQDPRWDVFYDMEKYITAKYPTIMNTAKLDHVNTHGLIITWEGSQPLQKPILMLAHQDVVPVLPDKVDDWTYPPYQGHFDGENIWGRGATDDKGYLISILESMDLLMKSGFKPKRSVILAFGCDEEISSENCGRPISEFLLDRYGQDGLYLVIDEGSVGVQREFNQTFAMVSVAEKGYLDIGINVTSTGGHASTPPDHNVIGIMSEIVTAIEANPSTGKVTTKNKNPMFGFMQCAAIYAPRSFPPAAARLLGGVVSGKKSAELQLAKEMDDMRYYFRTSQSVGKINGGVKINAIPELVTTVINLRLAVESSVAMIQDHYEKLVAPIAARHGMILEGFASEYGSPSKRKVSLFAIDPLEPAPVSPVDAEAFQVLSGTIRHTIPPLKDDKNVIVTPYLMAANTDTKWFWKLTKNIYRFTPLSFEHGFNRAHTTDEFIKASEFVREPYFFASLVLNADDAASEKE